MIEIYPPYKGTNTATGFECQVIGIAREGLDTFIAICIGEEGELHIAPLTDITVDWRYDRKTAQWLSIADPEPAP